MAKAKKTNGIQAVVDNYANGIVRRGVLREQTSKNEQGIAQSGDAIRTHVLATSPTSPVAYLAKNGRTLIVEPSEGIRTIEPGALKAPELPPPPTAEVADSVAELLSKGLVAEAQRLITESLTGGAEANTAQTATEQHLKSERILSDMVRRTWKESNLAEMYGSGGNAFRLSFVVPHGAQVRDFWNRQYETQRPAIELETFKSATMGPIKMSRRARSLLLENRNVVQAAIVNRDYNAKGMIVSKSRGQIAGYISELEQRVNDLTAKLAGATGATNV